MSKLLKWTIGLILVAGIGATVYSLVAPHIDGGQGARRPTAKAGFKGKRGPPRDAVPVLASKAETADVPIHLDGLGTVRALNTVTIQPMVDGRLLGVDFKEGQDVKRGDLLARIDPAVYEAQLAQALAKKAQDEAQLADARRELERVSGVGPIATLRKNVDTARAKVDQLEALVKADQASIDLAQTNLNHTRVTAPIDGRTGIRMVDEGNVVRAGSTAGIVMITQVRPISVLFNLPQQQLARVNAAIRASPNGEIVAEALAPDGRTVVDRGLLKVVDNQVDQTTGTVRLKAELPNETLALWPGQFVNVRIKVEQLLGVTVVPTAAVQQGPSGPFVYVVSEEGLARMRPVRIAAQTERIATIAEGVKPGEQVITSSFSRIREDSAVTTTLQPLLGPDGAAAQPEQPRPPPQPKREWGKGGGEGKRARRKDAEAGTESTPRATESNGAGASTAPSNGKGAAAP